MEATYMVVFSLGVTALIVWVIMRALKPHDRVCTACHTVSKIQGRPRGSPLIEIILWLCFLLPGLLYTIWRGGRKVFPCPACGSDTVPANTPAGRKIAESGG